MWLRRGRGRREVPIDDLRQNKKTALLLTMPDSQAGPETAFYKVSAAGFYLQLWLNLTLRNRRAIELREFDELSRKETAPMMGSRWVGESPSVPWAKEVAPSIETSSVTG
jgi:hypothetical protein